MKQLKWVVIVCCIWSLPGNLWAQSKPGVLPDSLTLDAVINYALENHPNIQQAIIDREITDENIKSRLSAWYPQVNFGYNLQHNFVVQTSIIGGNPVKLGVENTSAFQFTATQQIFNRDLLLAKRTKGDVEQLANQQISNSKITVVANASKAFYDVLATMQQIKVTQANIQRLERSLKDATAQYEAGLNDKTDYKRATIALNNAKASLRGNNELLTAKQAYLKFLIGLEEQQNLTIISDSMQLEQGIVIDTDIIPQVSDRIEYQQLKTQRSLQEANVRYNRWGYLPTVSLNGAYNFNYLNNQLSKLYAHHYPNSFAGINMAWPIFQGGKRKADLQAAKWELSKIDFSIRQLENAVNAEYKQAMASYKSALSNYEALKENVELAQEVYDVIDLQYKSGIKTYLEVITSETDLRTAQINYFNSLFQVLSSKIDVQTALGQIKY